jgi:hypothetical protein
VDPIPPLDAQKQRKTPILALHRPNATLQVADSILVRREIRYAAEQWNFAAEQPN